MIKLSPVKTVAEAHAQNEQALAQANEIAEATRAIYNECVEFDGATKIVNDLTGWKQIIINNRDILCRMENDFKTGQRTRC